MKSYCLETSYQVLVVIFLTIKIWLLSEALDFNYSAQDSDDDVNT